MKYKFYAGGGYEKELPEMTDAELRQVVNRCPSGYEGASTTRLTYVSDEIFAEMGRRSERRRIQAWAC